jgi:DNA methylase
LLSVHCCNSSDANGGEQGIFSAIITTEYFLVLLPNSMQHLQSVYTPFSDTTITKEWVKILTQALSFSGISGRKSPWSMADLAHKVVVRWKNHPKYNLSGLAAVSGISVSRLRLLARTASFFPPKDRVTQLSIGHHIEAMRGDPDRAHFWLKQACEKGWSGKDIRLAIDGDGDPRKYSWLRCGTVWYFSSCDSRFGIEYPGRIPGQIAANAIHYYTNSGDLVVDLMAGGGSTLDAATFLGRHCLAYDLAPSRFDIAQHDALSGLPEGIKNVQLFFLDPPYGSIAKGFYNNHPHCLSRMDEDSFIAALTSIAASCQQALVPGGYLALVVQNVHGWTYHTSFAIVEHLQYKGWLLARRIQIPISTQHISSPVIKWAKENRQMVNIDRDLLIFRYT